MHTVFTAATLRTSCLALAFTVPASAQTPNGTHDWGERNTSFEPAFEGQFRAPITASDFELETESLVGGLVHPWAVEVLPEDAGYLVTERSGTLRHVSPDGTLSEPLEGVPEVLDQEQGGLLDAKIGPDFAEDRMVYLTYAKPMEGDMSATAAGRGRLTEDLSAIEDFADIFVQEPASPDPMHYGSRIVFDDNGHAFITTGEHFTFQNRMLAQQLDTTFGKVVRVNLNGSTPGDNPFAGSENAIDTIWSYGHRNVQGAAMREGALWTLEHGPAGGDELNVSLPGENYGWPLVSYGRRYEQAGGRPIGIGRASLPGIVEPAYFWDPVIAPGDFVFYQGDEFPEWEDDVVIAALVAGGLVRLNVTPDGVTEEERLVSDLGRVRDVEIDTDGSLLLLTDFENGELVRITKAGGGESN